MTKLNDIAHNIRFRGFLGTNRTIIYVNLKFQSKMRCIWLIKENIE